ncbi:MULTISPECIES: crossover junction endodeoxyribonuclease RuvC [unclassified Campylobacter]|uniref:crossover junction endodeoxyribonuclease RuvC n=1 Tax=unclassified Campylobacter TaxID=2593542 RepID=UPI001B24F67C|nr:MULTISPECIES: crossover junction endodeoxyribonuclease RuvC [unclassified Campylobacter]MBO7475596.1 crossover junction endodeoxyribonuclease RuvC [Campylobacter sp.]MDA3056633.1 crossover junction endodeoxyribonuclease RuvC [Campylobacter sp. CN_NA1]MDA3065728.1 crossover junction endodeoxyribonuclease RuvC [Campylobacter sp. CN_NE4]MDA3069005.1 crossover junction endodeoxyribonuclease RuvC [Campylobacter sp. CN_NE3]MDA3080117.1 crossover junction endodeoxyribonuclease RuvC [Campylobacter 
MKILGIDPGTRNMGYAILEKSVNKISLVEAGLVKMKPENVQFQMTQMCEAIDQIFATHKIDEVAIESMFYAYNPQSVLKLAQFRGALSLKILQIYGNFAEYTPLQVKKSVTGKAKAAKEQVAFMVKRILGIQKEIKPLDITDAIAIALTHANNLRLQK